MFQRILYVSAVIAAATLTPARLMANPILYTFTWGDGTLETFDATSTSVPTAIGSMGFQAKFGGLAYDTDNNTMYMVDGTGNDSTTDHSSLYSVNLTTGAATLIGSTGVGAEVTGLTYDSANHTLYAAQDVSNAPLLSLNIATGAATAVGTGITNGEVQNLAYDSTNGVLYGWSDCGNCSVLYSVDTTTGVGTVLSNTGLSSNDSGLVYDPVTDLMWDLDVAGQFSTINPTTFAQTVIVGGPQINTELSGLALIPGTSNASTPEPSTIVFMGAGVAMLWARWRRLSLAADKRGSERV